MRNLNDDQLISMIRSKNKKAFEQLYDKYAGAVYGTIYTQVKDKTMAEEILQETFLKAWHMLSDASSVKDHLLMWMMNVARNLVNERTAYHMNADKNLSTAV